MKNNQTKLVIGWNKDKGEVLCQCLHSQWDMVRWQRQYLIIGTVLTREIRVVYMTLTSMIIIEFKDD